MHNITYLACIAYSTHGIHHTHHISHTSQSKYAEQKLLDKKRIEELETLLDAGTPGIKPGSHAMRVLRCAMGQWNSESLNIPYFRLIRAFEYFKILLELAAKSEHTNKVVHKTLARATWQYLAHSSVIFTSHGLITGGLLLLL